MDSTAEQNAPLLSISDWFFKAEPKEEDGRRFIYMEASNGARDIQGEIVAQNALAESAPYYLRYGNLDLEHRSVIGKALGQRDYMLHEIGRPEDVKVRDGKTFVKGAIFKGDGPVAESANRYWDSLTKLEPPQRWYPSVGGKVLGEEHKIDARTGEPTRRLTKIRWNNIGFSRTPVNTAVSEVSTVPFGVFAKCFDRDGVFDLCKALEAGYGTDSATLSGGAALRQQSLDPKMQNYWDFRERLAGDLRKGAVGQSARDMIAHATSAYGIDPAQSAEHVERFLADLKDGLSKNKGKTDAKRV